MSIDTLRRLLLAGLVLAAAAGAQDDYQPGPDSQPQPGVPAGEMIPLVFERGEVFFDDPGARRSYRIGLDGAIAPLAGSPTAAGAGGIALSPDPSMAFVADGPARWIHRYLVGPDGGLADGQRLIRLHAADDGRPSTGRIRADRDGRLYVATDLGIQVCAQAALVNAVVPTPSGTAVDLCFGGPNFDVLFAFCGDKVFRRRLAVRGANAWDIPNKPAEKL